MAATRLRVVIFTSMAPQAVMRLSSRIQSEVAQAEIAGIVYELPRHKPLRTRFRDFLRNLRRPAFVKYVARRLWGATGRVASDIGDAILRFIHADTKSSTGRQTGSSLLGLKHYCAARDVPLHVTNDLHDEASLEFTRALDPALGLVFGTRILKPELFEIPRQGSINIHKRKVPEYKGGGPIGLWELLDRQHEMGITVHRVAQEVDAGAIVAETSLPIEQFDTLTSLALKADVVGDDLLIQTVAAFAQGSVADRPQAGPGRTFRKPGPEELIACERRIAADRPPYRPGRGRPGWKLLLRGVALAPWLVARNWWRRIRVGFPVMILCHHVVTDRAHCLGIPTEWFLKHVEFLQKHYNIVPLSEAVDLLRTGNRVRRPTVALTLDDGYGDNYLNLRAIAQATGVPLTLFVCPEKISQQAAFDHDLEWGLADFRPLTWSEVQQLDRDGIQIASHTRSHFDCGSTQRERLCDEITGAKYDLETRLGKDVTFFAFPWGKPENMSGPALELARNYYTNVFSAFGGENYPNESGASWHFRRVLHPNDLWELELALQSILEFGTSTGSDHVECLSDC